MAGRSGAAKRSGFTQGYAMSSTIDSHFSFVSEFRRRHTHTTPARGRGWCVKSGRSRDRLSLANRAGDASSAGLAASSFRSHEHALREVAIFREVFRAGRQLRCSCRRLRGAYNGRAYCCVRQPDDQVCGADERARGGPSRSVYNSSPPTLLRDGLDRSEPTHLAYTGCTNCSVQRHKWFAEKKTGPGREPGPFSLTARRFR